MKLQRTPIVLLLTALALGGFVYFYELQKAPKQETQTAQSEPLFSFKEEDVQALTLTTQTQTLAFTRNAGSTPASWQMTTPTNTRANDASIAFLLNLLATGKSQQTLTIPAAKRAEFGLEKPLAIAEVKLANQQTHRLVLGSANFNRSAMYAQIDPPVNPSGDQAVKLVAIDFENAVTRPAAEWQAEPPAKPTPKPTPKPTKPADKP